MIGTRLYQKKSQARLFLVLYGLLALAGCAQAALSISNNRSVSGAAGFMVVFGLGMVARTLLESRKAQVSVHADFLEVDQSGTPRTLRYRTMTSITQPDAKRLVVTLRENGATKNEVIWLKELDPEEVSKLKDFLLQRPGRQPRPGVGPRTL